MTTVPVARLDAAAESPMLDGFLGARADRLLGEASGENIASGVCPAQPQKQTWPGMLAGCEAELRALVRSPRRQPLDDQLRHAACRGMEPELYHPDQGPPGELALARCAGCRARIACLALALRAEDPDMRSGWYGGLGPTDRDSVAASLNLTKPEPASVPDPAARAAELKAAGWTLGAIAAELGCCRRTVQRYLRRAAA